MCDFLPVSSPEDTISCHASGIAQRLGTDSQPDELAQLADGWAFDDGVIQFYGDMSDQPSRLPDAPGRRAVAKE